MNLSEFSLENKVALITGGSSGIGKMMALALAKAGAFVWIASSRDNADETLQELKDQGSDGRFIQADVTSSEALKDIVSLINRESDQIDILVNAAGINLRTPAQDLTLDEWQKTIDINLTAPFHLSQLVSKSMKKK
jgi:NAD(P)-dependent dehydrogenase (short-subunit alcohol dehydrogenase family)